MRTVEAHELKFPDPQDELEFVARRVGRAPEKIAKLPKNTGVFFDESRRIVGFRASLGRPLDELVEALGMARDLGVGLFLRGRSTPDEAVEFTIGERTVEVPGGTSTHNTALRWVSAFGIGLVLRDDDALDSLCEYNPIDFEGSFDVRRASLVKALISMHRGDYDEASSLFSDAEEAAGLATDMRKWADRLEAPLARVGAAVHEGRQEGFADLVAGALEDYCVLFSARNQNHLAEHYLPLHYLGLCALAHDRGMSVGVESRYLPESLVAGDLPR